MIFICEYPLALEGLYYASKAGINTDTKKEKYAFIVIEDSPIHLQRMLLQQHWWFYPDVAGRDVKEVEQEVKKIFDSVLVIGSQRNFTGSAEGELARYTNFSKEVIQRLSKPPFYSTAYGTGLKKASVSFDEDFCIFLFVLCNILFY